MLDSNILILNGQAFTYTAEPSPKITAQSIIDTLNNLRPLVSKPTPEQIRCAEKLMGRGITDEEMNTLQRIANL